MTSISDKVKQVRETLKNFTNPEYKYSPVNLTREQSEDFLFYFFEENFVRYYRSRDHLFLMNEVLNKARNVRHTTRKKVFALIYLNYTLSEETKTLLYARYKLSKTMQEKTMADLILTMDPDLLNQQIKKTVLKRVLSFVDKEDTKQWYSFYLGQDDKYSGYFEAKKKRDSAEANLVNGENPFDLPTVSQAQKGWASNIIYVIKFFKSFTTNLKIFERYAFYFKFYGCDSIRSSWEEMNNLSSEEVLKMVFDNAMGGVCDTKTANLILESKRKEIEEKVYASYPFLENFPALSLNLFKLIAVYKILNENHGFTDLKENSGKLRFKEALDSIFGFHSSSLVNFLKEEAQKSPKQFFSVLARGVVAKNLLGNEQPDYIWRFLKLNLSADLGYFLFNNPEVKSRLTQLYSPEQLIVLLENSDLGVKHRESIQDLMLIQDAVHNMREDVLNLLKQMTFNEINSLKKLHDAASKIFARLKHKAFDLDLEKKYPSITSFNGAKLGESGYSIVVPKTNLDVIVWGQLLRNCVGGYSNKIRDGICLVLGVEKDGEISHCIEIARSNGSAALQQFKGFANVEAPKELKDLFKDSLPLKLIEEFKKFEPAYKEARPLMFMDMHGFMEEMVPGAEDLLRGALRNLADQGMIRDANIQPDEDDE